MCVYVFEGVRGQCMRTTSSLLFWRFQGLRWSHQPWWQETLSTEPTLAQCVSIYNGQLIYLFSHRIWESTTISHCCDCLIYNEVYLTGFACQMCFDLWNEGWGLGGAPLKGNKWIPEQNVLDVTSFQDVRVTSNKTSYFSLGSEVNHEGQIYGLELNSWAKCILDWGKHCWPHDCEQSPVGSSKVGKLIIEITHWIFLLVHSLGFLVELEVCSKWDLLCVLWGVITR